MRHGVRSGNAGVAGARRAGGRSHGAGAGQGAGGRGARGGGGRVRLAGGGGRRGHGAKKPAGEGAEGEEDVELDESLDDAAFIEEQEEGDPDVTDIIGDRENEEET